MKITYLYLKWPLAKFSKENNLQAFRTLLPICFFAFCLFEANGQASGTLVYKCKETYTESLLGLGSVLSFPTATPIYSLCTLRFNKNHAVSLQTPDLSKELMLAYRKRMRDSVLFYYDWNNTRKWSLEKDFDGQPIAVSDTILMLTGSYTRRKRKILGYQCQEIVINLKDRQIKAWVNKALNPNIGFSFLLSYPKVAVLAWEDDKGNSCELLELNTKEVLLDEVQVPYNYQKLNATESIDSIRPQSDVNQLEEGKPMPNFELTDISGKVWKSEDLKGKVVVFNFWFVNCKPCVAEIPELNQLVKKYPQVVFLALTFDSKARVDLFQSKKEFLYQLIPDAKNVLEGWQITTYPRQVVVNKSGIIKNYILEANIQALNTAITTLLSQE